MKTTFILVAVAVLVAFAITDTEDNVQLQRNARAAFGQNTKIKKTPPTKKSSFKKKKSTRKIKNVKKTPSPTSRTQKQTSAVDGACVAQIALAMRRWKDVVSNFIRQSKRITTMMETQAAGKADRMGSFVSLADDLLNLGGGNITEMRCAGTTEGDMAANLTKLTNDLYNCQSNINDTCNAANFPSGLTSHCDKFAFHGSSFLVNTTLIEDCKGMIEVFTAKAMECYKLSKKASSAREACACWTDPEMVQLTDDVKECKISQSVASIKNQTKSCFKAFGTCKKYEDETVKMVGQCSYGNHHFN